MKECVTNYSLRKACDTITHCGKQWVLLKAHDMILRITLGEFAQKIENELNINNYP